MRKRFFTIWLLVMFWIVPLISHGQNQGFDQAKAEALLSELEKGNYTPLKEFLAMGEATIPILLKRLKEKEPRVRWTALDLLGRIDSRDDEVLNQDEIINAMVKAIDGSEREGSVIERGLWFLQKIDPKKATPEMIQALLTQLENGQARAARILGRIGDIALRSGLEPYANSSDKVVAMLTRDALAKLGDQKYLAEILAELDVNDVWVRSEAFRKLAYIGNKAAVRKITQFLSDPGPPLSDSPHVEYTPYRFLAAWALSRIVDNPPVKKKEFYNDQDVAVWLAWWREHQHEYP
jgi:HEAT repeat protein